MWNKLKTGFPWAGVPEEEMEEADGEKTQKELDEEIKRKKERQVHNVNCKKQEEWQVHCKKQEVHSANLVEVWWSSGQCPCF